MCSKDKMYENVEYLEAQLITYLGNKRSLLPFIGSGVEYVKKGLKKDRLSILDLFSGTGVVSRFFKQHANNLIVNDLEDYSRIVNTCYLNTCKDDVEYANNCLLEIDDYTCRNLQSGFIRELYSPKNDKRITKTDRCFYTNRNAMYIDTARQKINDYPVDIQPFLIAPLLAQASIHTNTSGVFKGFYKNKKGYGQFGGEGENALVRILGDIKISSLVWSNFKCPITVHQKDANELVLTLPDVDVAYFDPPYNQHPYGSNYFMLNLIVNYHKPNDISKVSGIPVDWNRSVFNKSSLAEDALIQLVSNCPAKFIIISYNSDGIIPFDSFTSKLKTIGKLKVLEQEYNTFRGSRNLNGRDIKVSEYLFIVNKQ